jgi:hypothetical protein
MQPASKFTGRLHMESRMGAIRGIGRKTTLMKHIEAFTLGKKLGQPDLNEDSLVIMPGRGYGVIDGVGRVKRRAGRRSTRPKAGAWHNSWNCLTRAVIPKQEAKYLKAKRAKFVQRSQAPKRQRGLSCDDAAAGPPLAKTVYPARTRHCPNRSEVTTT